jgi:hypothetical protein
MDENNTQEGKTLLAIDDAGHLYRLFNEEGDGLQMVQFIKKEVDDATNTLVTVADGTTNEAVIAMLIDRLVFLNTKMPSEHNEVAIDRLRDAGRALAQRTAERVERGVEGTHTA